MKDNSTMTEGVIWKQLLFFSAPLIIGNLFQQLYNTVDSIIVGNYIGRPALAAVGVSAPIINLLVGVFMGIATGAGVIVSQLYGAEDRQNLKRAVHTTMTFGGLCGIALIIAGWFYTPWILEVMGTPAEILAESQTYLRIYFMGSFFSLVYNMGTGILNAVGDSKSPLYYLGVASVVNIILDFVFVLGFKMGVEGVGLATVVSQLVSVLLVLRKLMISDEVYGLEIKALGIHRFSLKRIVLVGVPAGLQNMVISLSNVVIQSSINAFGAVAVAGCGAYNKIDGFMFLPIISFSMAATTFTGQNMGARRYDRVIKGMKASLLIGFAYTLIMSGLLLTFGREVLSVFTQDKEVVDFGLEFLYFLVPFYFLMTLIQILAGTIRGAGKTLATMIIIVCSLCIFRILWLKIMMPFWPRIETVFVVYPISWLIGAIAMIIYTWRSKWIDRSY